MSFLEKYDKEFAPKLATRAGTFRRIFEELEKKNKDFYTVVETGCARIKGNFTGDGMSTVLFDAFINYYDGKVYSVDINDEHCKVARSLVSNKTEVICDNSLHFLAEFSEKQSIDLLYLDSFDIKFAKPHESALHHLKEFVAVFASLQPGTVIAIDDNEKNPVSGKGMYVAEFLEDLGYEKFIDEYQIGWIL